ncbi:NADH-quinone oxidoreductase subunit C [Spirochaeta isovalerica]|uniref:NADH-quinone oxidoreductase subunit C n=1 Tax=Spirochaeta isovalerica TaxID=150 RepID=A0A841RBK4_9SPIO|nr:NADH-quinone oxidoreductase subunit C [Spirochaeta isovalerica]MBB6480289.1 NADH-quinone oxidoreductase subunit C [Spirochaeta isovalerica]
MTEFNELSRQFQVSDLVEQRADLHFITASKEHAVAVVSALKERYGYTHLVFFTVVDHLEKNEFHLTYMLHNYEKHHDMGVVVKIARENVQMESIHHLWPAAATYQQEMREMYGVEFPGSPGLYENFALEGWEDIPPMRRDFDTKEYSDKTYYPRPGRESHDPREYMKENLYPSEAETW